MDYASIGLNCFIAVLVAIITAKLSVRGFYRQEIWLRKEKRYSEIIEHLNIIQKHYDDLFNEFAGIDKEKDDQTEWNEKFQKSQRELELVALDYLIIMKPKVAQIIKDLLIASNTRTQNERMGDCISYVDRMYAEVKDAKVKIIEIAKSDLNL